ncbi:MAG: hypothetical protein Phog2KO_11290 [Phototrophicaceae bacterium]
MLDLAGKVLKSYEVQERIGAGGFGAVFRAIQPTIGREVAVKIILPQYANQPEFVRRFEVEAQLVARLEHPHIVPLYDYWREPGGAYLVMRYLRGGSLRDSLEENGAWSAQRVGKMLTQIASALHFAHINGVIHRDLKTDNILLDEADNVYLTDFGIAKDLGILENHTQDAILGTPAYLSPEQIRGESASIRSDIYSLGIMVFEALTASKPFFDATPATVLFKQLNDPLPSVTDYRNDIPEALDDVLQRATAKDSTLRYDDVLSMARDFTAILTGTPSFTDEAGTSTLDILSITQQTDLAQISNPYKGLRAFQTVDANDFFGRDELIERLLQHISLAGKHNDFLAVVGPSGSGKSSVVKAGMIPHIQNGILDKEVDWYTAEIVPGTHPMEELEVALLAVATHEIPDLYDILSKDERGLVRAIKRIVPEDSEFVLFIDQFEEAFTLVSDNDERTHFLQSILNAVEDERSRIKIIVTLRADFYDRPLLYADFGNLIRKHTELVLPLNETELEASISSPAQRVGVSLEPGLVSAIINDVAEQPGALPLLQYALTELFERRKGRLMLLSDYKDIGGTTGALARRAEELYEGFTPEEKSATRQMFMRLVTLGEGSDDTRRRVFQSELLSLNNQASAMPNVIRQFGKYRLLTFDHDPQTRSSTIEVAHEALIRQWERVRAWLDENREALRMHRRLTSATEEWTQTRREATLLARGIRLQQFEALAVDSDIALNDIETTFLTMSIEARQERERVELERQEREEELEARARRRLQLLATFMAVAAFIAIGLLFFAVSAQQSAVDSANEAATSEAIALQNEAEARALALAANARNAANIGDPQLALVLALEAEQAFSPPPVDILRTLSTITYAPGASAKYTNHDASVTSVEFSDDSQYIISSSVDGSIHVTDNQAQEEILLVNIEQGWLYDAAIHPDNETIAGAASDGNIYVWSFPDGGLLYTLEGHTDEVMTVDYSPDGQFIVSGSADHDIILWSLADRAAIQTLSGHTGVVLNVVFSPDGSRIASSSADETLGNVGDDVVDRTVRIWNIETLEDPLIIIPDSGFVRALDFSPTGDTVAYGVWDSRESGTVRVHDANTGEEVQRFLAHTTPITAVAYSADGNKIASVAWDRTVRIWDLELGIENDSFVGFDDRVLSMAYSLDGQSLVLGIGNIGNNIYSGEDSAIDQSIWVWDVNNRDQINAFTEHPNWAWTVDLSPDSQLAASSGGPLSLPDNLDDVSVREALLASTTVLVWNVQTQEIIAELPAHENTVDSVRFHPDGTHLLTSSWDTQIILWDFANESEIRRYEAHTDRVNMLRFLGDGSQFVSVSKDGRAILWDTETGEIIREFEHGISVNGVDFSSDETLMASSSGDFGADTNLIWLWDINTGELIRNFEGHGHIVNEVRFHPSDEYLVSSSWDASIRVWDVATGAQVRDFSGHSSETFGIDFSEDGEIMLTTSSDTTVRMWDWESGEELQLFNEHNDWVQEVVFSFDDSFAVSAGQDPAVRIWRINRDAQSLEIFAQENRYIRELTCSERDVYRLTSCE